MTEVRLRYAPSPTGEPHLGNIRTALFNWLFARSKGGKFVLRVEDTDQDRVVPKSLESIKNALAWLGLDWDEGPDISGPYGPYYQSERKDLGLYQAVIEDLIQKDLAYYCYCTPEELKLMRDKQVSRNEPPGYNRTCRDLTIEDRNLHEKANDNKVVRFKVPTDGRTDLTDLVRSYVSWENRLIDDFVILKSDGFPTYHLASVVDDHAMKITHVLRAEEWLPSAPKHVMLYKSLSYELPHFAHLPMILGPDKAKLSKRHGATSVLEYMNNGFLPEAMVNFMALLGWSKDDKTEIITKQELVTSFSLERVIKSAAIFNSEKLSWMNGMYIRNMTDEELLDSIIPFLERPESEMGLLDSISRPLDKSYVARIIPLIKDRLKRLSEGPELTSFFFVTNLKVTSDKIIQKSLDIKSTLEALQAIRESIMNLEKWEADTLEGLIRPLTEKLGIKPGALFGTIRMAITNSSATPPLFETMSVLGKDRCLTRLQEAERCLIRS